MRNKKQYDLPALPATNDKRAQHFLNPDGNALHLQAGGKRIVHDCKELVVENGMLVCSVVPSFTHAFAVWSIDNFIRDHPELMKKHLQR